MGSAQVMGDRAAELFVLLGVFGIALLCALGVYALIKLALLMIEARDMARREALRRPPRHLGGLRRV